MTITVEQLTDMMVDRMPFVPREALAALAEAVGEMCEEVRLAEREACAQIAWSWRDGYGARDVTDTAEGIAKEIRNRTERPRLRSDET